MVSLVNLLSAESKQEEESLPFSSVPASGRVKWRQPGEEGAHAGGRTDYLCLCRPLLSKGELHMPTALGEHPKPSAGWKRVSGVVLFLRHP